ncbi:hypothetical protein [Amycolatopsis rubida]|uniref:Uncharacterized protein n=1 Tax=Amycolatopsis rubida TaxID=112413 RepID=A0A1I5UT17_9PSEU|nr:hypothetical protein [Amycolatopsis rubida]SFP98401.1 hypothetical protein SAMN05421854_10883 [Amycolatopsis rubida]
MYDARKLYRRFVAKRPPPWRCGRFPEAVADMSFPRGALPVPEIGRCVEAGKA